MYNYSDILIIGDSFCSARHRPDVWPNLVVALLSGDNRDPRGKGFQGASFWSVRKLLLTELEQSAPKVLILCHTEPGRLPSDQDLGLNYSSAKYKEFYDPFYKKIKVDKKIIKATVDFYENIFCRDFFKWALLQWQKELDSILEKYPQIEKIIHMYSFDGEHIDYTFARGVTVSIPLYNYAESDDTPHVWNRTYNHFSLEKNKIFADNLLKIINNYPGDGVRVDNNLTSYE